MLYWSKLLKACTKFTRLKFFTELPSFAHVGSKRAQKAQKKPKKKKKDKKEEKKRLEPNVVKKLTFWNKKHKKILLLVNN